MTNQRTQGSKMKTRLMGMLMALGTALVLSGCGEGSTTSTSSGGGGAAPAKTDPAKAIAAEAAKAVDAAKAAVPDVTKAVQSAAKSAGDATTQAVNGLLAEVQKLVADGKGSEAVQKIQSALSGLKLTPEQQKIVDDLKKQAQEALSKKGVDAATKAVGDLLAPKPQK